MCKSSKDTTTTATQTTTPNVPDWIQQPYQDYSLGVQKFASSDPLQYVAGPSDLQTKAFTAGGALSSNPNGTFSQGQGLAMTGAMSGTHSATPALMTAAKVGPVTNATSTSGLTGLQSWMDPYTDQVVNATLAGQDQNDAITRARQAASAAGTNAFGGSRYAVLQGVTAGQQALARAQTEGTLRDRGFQTAAQYSTADADRATQVSEANAAAANAQAAQQATLDQGANSQNSQTSTQASEFNAGQADNADNRQITAAGVLGDLGTRQGQLAAGNVALQGALGDTQRGITADQLAAPINQLQMESSLYAGIPSGLFTGSTTNGSSSSTTTNHSSFLDDLQSLGKSFSLFTGGGGGANAASMFNGGGGAAAAA